MDLFDRCNNNIGRKYDLVQPIHRFLWERLNGRVLTAAKQLPDYKAYDNYIDLERVKYFWRNYKNINEKHIDNVISFY